MSSGADPAYDKALLIALRALRASEKTEAEIRERLHRRGVDEGVTGRVIHELKRRKYLDEERIVEQELHKAESGSTRGKLRTLHTLQRRGLSEDHLHALDQALDFESEVERALRVLGRKFAPSDKVIQGAAFLARKGFEEEVVRTACERHFDDTDGLPLSAT